MPKRSMRLAMMWMVVGAAKEIVFPHELKVVAESGRRGIHVGAVLVSGSATHGLEPSDVDDVVLRVQGVLDGDGFG